MRGDNHLLAVTSTTDEITGEVKPLFAFPIQVCKATAAEADVKFDAAAPSGAPYKTQYVDEATGEVFEWDQRQRGVRIGDHFKPIPDESIKEIEESTKLKTIVVEGSAPLADVREKFGDRVTAIYFVQSPKDGSPKAYRLLMEALLGDDERPATALVMKRSARTRQKLCFMYADPARQCLVLNEVAFPAAMREPDEMVLSPNLAQVEQKQVNMVRTVIDGMEDGLVALGAAEDEAVPMKKALIDKAVEGEAIIAPPKPVAETAAEDQIEAALMASIGG